MQLHELQPKTRMRRGIRVGRGGKRGTTAGRGTKGQKARAGHKIRPQLREIMKRMPKLRGYKFRSFRRSPVPLSLAIIERHFSKGEKVTLEELVRKGVLRRRGGRVPSVKILGNHAQKALSYAGLLVSRGAREAIKNAGGSVQ